MTGPDKTPAARIRFGEASKEERAVRSFGRSGAVTGIVVLVLVLSGLGWSALASETVSAVQPHLFGGSLVLEDARPLTVIDVGTARITVRLEGVDSEVGAAAYSDVEPVPSTTGTMLVNRLTGAFNFLATDNYIVDSEGPGVGLGPLPGSTGAEGLAAGSRTYIVRSATASTVTLVDRATVSRAAGLQSADHPSAPGQPAAAVNPPGFADLTGSVSLAAGSAAVDGTDLWVLQSAHGRCQILQLHPDPTSHQGLALTPHGYSPAACDRSALEVAGSQVALAWPGGIRPVGGADVPRSGRQAVIVPASSDVTEIRPAQVDGASFWFLERAPGGWSLVGATADARRLGPFLLPGLSSGADPVAPVLSHGFLYTLDQGQTGRPTLWTIDTTGGRMAPLPGLPRYPVINRSERASFAGAQVIGDGPRVIFNNPESHEAVVVFTDGSRPPAVIDKSRAEAVSTTGPADLADGSLATGPGQARAKAVSPAPGSSGRPVPVVQPVSQQITCANTTQKPYAPEITAVSPSSGAALVSWSYQLLDQTDCEPASWAVRVSALSGGHQPAQPLQIVEGQSQYLFTGLRPATTYQVTVTAYINSQFTSSLPVTFTTSPRGPDAPLAVTTISDGRGDWVVSWTPCTETANPNCVVPADKWTVVGTACNSSIVGSPPNVQVAGNQFSVTIDSDSLGLLGQSLTFSVEGSLDSGLTGNPTSDRGCTEAWRPPNLSALSLAAEGAPDGGTITATLTVDVSGDPTEAFGCQPSETEFVYTVGDQTVGPTSQTRVTVTGLPAGQTFTPTVEVYPAGHQAASVTVTGPPFSKTLEWPSDLSSAQVTAAPDQDPNEGTVVLTFPQDVPNAPLVAQGASINCGSVQSEPDQPVTGGALRYKMDLIDQGGDCQLELTLNDTADPNPYGGPSSALTYSFHIGEQPDYSFTAQVLPPCDQNFACGGPPGATGSNPPYQVQVSSTGQPLGAGGDWFVVASVTAPTHGKHGPPGGGAGDPCYAKVDVAGPAAFPVTVTLPPGCPDASTVDFTVGYTYLGQAQQVDAGQPGNAGLPGTLPPPPPPPTTLPCPTTTTTATTTTTTTTTSTTTTTTTTKNGGSTTTSGGHTTIAATSATTTGTTSTTGPGCTATAGVASLRPGAVAAGATVVGLVGLVWPWVLRSPASRRRRRKSNIDPGESGSWLHQ